MIETEGDLQFDFTGCVKVTKLDRQGVQHPHGMRLVDFVVEEATRCLLVEVKDPFEPTVPAANQAVYLAELKTKKLVAETFVPKCRDSYTFQRLMGEDGKPFLYVILIGSGSVPMNAAMLLTLADRVRRQMKQETDRPWVRQYATDCVVLDLGQWSKAMPYPVARLSATATT
ncbi:MAG: hypothetical protein IT204_21325 [Fimbriimonadaceae bacterium]|nr:hypothetical protein [Fimbriimonadaceae bacterium]